MLSLKKKPFLIAEVSANHCGSINIAKKLIDDAKKYGADAVKFQTFSPDTMTLNSNKKDFLIKEGIWKGTNLWNIYNKAQTPLKWHKELFNYCKRKKIICLSTPFDETAVIFLEKINCPIYKISSFEMTDIPLIKKIAKTRKPIIMSTGMANLKEIEISYNIAKKNGAKEIILLYCVSNYPSKVFDFNLKNIEILKNKFKCRVGLSDHSKDNIIAKLAIAAGADIIEKHIALKNHPESLDFNFSIKGKEIRQFRNDIDLSYQLMGKNKFCRSKEELRNRKFRRSIYIAKNIKKGEKFTKENLRKVRPGGGVNTVYYEKILGKKAFKSFSAGTSFTHKNLKKLNIKKQLIY
jgi:pseudaminic acid synthase